MYQFHSAVNTATLNSNYLKIFKHIESYGKKFEKLLEDYPNLKEILPVGITFKKLITYPFVKLTDIYYGYVNLTRTWSEKDKKTLDERIQKFINYKSHYGKIRKFLVDPVNGFEINNCIYCDLNHVGGHIKENGERKLECDVEHILDKGTCPLVGLSIYNFLPSCVTCNDGAHKGIKPLGASKADTLRLSPTHYQNNFEHKVHFNLLFNSDNIEDLNMWKDLNAWNVGFLIDDDVYEQTISMFELEQRYNSDYHKHYFGEYLEKKLNNPPNVIRQMANLKNVTYEDVYEELFDVEKKRSQHASREKCRLELMSYFDKHYKQYDV